MSRSKRKTLAEETLGILDSGGYDVGGRFVALADDLRDAVDEARLLRPADLKRMSRTLTCEPTDDTAISVLNETTLEAANRLAGDAEQGAVLVLNFASAKNPGGGFLGGSQAQEESLARSSALYPTLTACRDYYDINRGCGTALYTDHMIYSPNIPVFRDDSGGLLDEPYLISVLTSPAVNAGAVMKNEPENGPQIESVMRRRIGYVLHAALALGHRDLVLGAWGCGVFRNDPAQIAGLFAEQLMPGGLFAGRFRRIEFAVLDRQGHGKIIGPFEQALLGTQTDG